MSFSNNRGEGKMYLCPVRMEYKLALNRKGTV